MNIKGLERYFSSEYNFVKQALKNTTFRYNPKEVVNNAIQRMLGASDFFQRENPFFSYEELEQLYNTYKEKLENLLTD